MSESLTLSPLLEDESNQLLKMWHQVMVAALMVVVVVDVTLADPGSYEPVYKPEPLPYYFNYDVQDHYKGTNFGQHEKSDGKAVYGSYTVDLPDGRRQRVDYTADHYKGYVAKVSYYGKAKHPKHYGSPATFFQDHSYGHGYGHGSGHGHH